MDPVLSSFLETRTVVRADLSVSLISLYREFSASLPDDRSRRVWPRWRFKSEIAKQFLVGTDHRDVCQVAGLSLDTPRKWERDGRGRLRLVAA